MKIKILVAGALLILVLCLSGDSRIGQAAAPKFNTTYVKNEGQIIKLKNVNPKKVTFLNYNDDFLVQNGNYLQLDDNKYGFQGGISYIRAKYKNKQYKQLIGYGNLIPFDLVIKKGNTKNFFNKSTRKVLNSKKIKITVDNPSIVSVSSKGTIKAKNYGSTTVRIKWKKYKGYCKVFVLPIGLKKEDIFQGYMTTYANKNNFLNKNYYKYYVNKKALNEMNNSFTGDFGIWGTIDHKPLQFVVVNKNNKQDLQLLDRNLAVAIYRTNFNKIIVRNNMLTPGVTLHQFGHFIDHYNSPTGYIFVSASPQYQNYFCKYKDQFKNISQSYALKSSQEYFAESYMLYIISPYYMKKYMPNTYKWMDKFMRTHGYI